MGGFQKELVFGPCFQAPINCDMRYACTSVCSAWVVSALLCMMTSLGNSLPASSQLAVLTLEAHIHDTHPFTFLSTHLHTLFPFPHTHLYTPFTISPLTPSKPHPCGLRSLAGARVGQKIEKSMVQIPLLSLSSLFAVRSLLFSMPQFRHRDSNPGRSGEGRVS